MIKSNMLAALMGLVAASGFASAPKVTQPPVYHRATPSMGRSRIPGKPGRAGDKMARMAAEGRLGVRS